MNRARFLLVLALGTLCGGLAACGDDSQTGSGPSSGPGGSGGGGGAGGGVAHLTLFHTSDEHGWLAPDDASEPGKVFGGAAQLMGELEADGYDRSTGLLVSSGDNWTGPAISTWFKGESAVEVFDAMGYAASAVGNHEVDFGLDVLAERSTQASYPYLAANIRDLATGERPAYLEAFRIVEIDGVSIGLIGMAGRHTATTADPRITASLSFESPAETLVTVAPEARAAGAQVLVVLFHDCDIPELLVAGGPAVDLVLAGHCHAVRKRNILGVPVVESGAYFHGYSRIAFDFDRAAGAVGPIDVEYREVSHLASGAPEVAPDGAVGAIVDEWQAQVDVDLGMEVGTTASGIPQRSWLMGNWITDSWRAQHPEADVGILNVGAMRQAIAPGPFTVADVFGVLPFDNRLLEIDLTGAELVTELTRAVAACGGTSNCSPMLSGARYVAGTDPLEVDVGGVPIDPTATYRIITTDYLYYGGDQYELASYDDTPLELGENFRDPVIDWTLALGTSAADPLEAHLDPLPRDQ